MKLSICIVSWNVAELLEKCLISIKKHPPTCAYEIIVVDNASKDMSPDVVGLFPEAKLIQNTKNLGFSAANNQAIKESCGEYVLFLNPDTEAAPGALDELVSFLDGQSKAAAVAPKLLNPDKSLQRSCMGFPTLGAMAMRQLFIEQLWRGNPYTKKYLMTDLDYDRSSEVDQPMGACLMVRKNVLDRVGTFDEHSFMFFDEVDLCYRIKKAGLKIFFTPEAQVIHHGGSSIKKWGVLNLGRHWSRSRNLYFKKHHGTAALAALYFFDLLRVLIFLTVGAAIITAAKTAIDIHWEAVRPR